MADPIAWWGAISGTAGVVVAGFLGMRAVLQERAPIRLSLETGALDVPKRSDVTLRLVLRVMFLNRSSSPVAIVEVTSSFDPEWHSPVLLDYAADDDRHNLRLPVNLGPGEAKSGNLSFAIYPNQGELPAWESFDSEPRVRPGRHVRLEVVDSRGRKTQATTELFIHRKIETVTRGANV